MKKYLLIALLGLICGVDSLHSFEYTKGSLAQITTALQRLIGNAHTKVAQDQPNPFANIPYGFLLYGKNKNKAQIVRSLASKFAIPVITITQQDTSNVSTLFLQAHAKALRNSNKLAIIFIDKLDTFSYSSFATKLNAELQKHFSTLYTDYKVIVIGTAEQLALIDSALLVHNRLHSICIE